MATATDTSNVMGKSTQMQFGDRLKIDKEGEWFIVLTRYKLIPKGMSDWRPQAKFVTCHDLFKYVNDTVLENNELRVVGEIDTNYH